MKPPRTNVSTGKKFPKLRLLPVKYQLKKIVLPHLLLLTTILLTVTALSGHFYQHLKTFHTPLQCLSSGGNFPPPRRTPSLGIGTIQHTLASTLNYAQTSEKTTPIPRTSTSTSTKRRISCHFCTASSQRLSTKTVFLKHPDNPTWWTLSQLENKKSHSREASRCFTNTTKTSNVEKIDEQCNNVKHNRYLCQIFRQTILISISPHREGKQSHKVEPRGSLNFLFFSICKHERIFVPFVYCLSSKDLCGILSRRCCYQISEKPKPFASLMQLNLPVLPVSVFLPLIKLQVQFTTPMGDDSAKPLFRKSGSFVFKDQAVTSESDSKIRIFSPFPQIPVIKLTPATYMFQSYRRAPDSIGVMVIRKNCKFLYFNEAFALFLQQLETTVRFLEYELTAALQKEKCLFVVANFINPPGARRDVKSGGRSNRAIGEMEAVTADAGLFLE